MKYRMLATVMLLLVVFSFPAHSAARGAEDVRVFIDGEEIFAVTSVFLGEHLFVPLRPILRELGAEITGWEKTAGVISARKKERTAVLKIDQPFAWINGKAVKLDAPPTVVSGTTMVTLDLFENFLELSVRWNPQGKTLEIENPSFIPFERPVKGDGELPAEVQKWLENSLNELNIQVKRAEEKIYILATYGLKNSGGYEVKIKKVERLKDNVKDYLSVIVEFSEPPEDYFTIPVIDRPFDLVSIEAAQIEDHDYIICFARGLKEEELPVRLELNY